MADISKITIPVGNSTQTFNIKDAAARTAIAGGVTFAGVTTTTLTDGASTSTITVGGQSVTATNGMLAIYGSKEFIFSNSDSKWHELGDLTGFDTATVKSLSNIGSVPTFTVSNEILTITAGTTAQGTDVTVVVPANS